MSENDLISSEKQKQALNSGLEYLLAMQKDGLWSYSPGHQSAMEPSAWAAIALSDYVDVANRFVETLLASQNADGGWSNEPARLESDWSTAAALHALQFLRERSARASLKLSADESKLKSVCQKAQTWILENRVEYYSSAAKFALLLWKGPEHDYVRGWPWTQETFDWVEPTSYVLLSLRYSNNSNRTGVNKAIDLGEKYLLNLVCSNGGWNFGDRNPYGSENPPDVQSSAMALLALKTRKNDSKVRQSIKWMLEKKKKTESVLQDSWLALALCTYEENCDELLAKLQAVQDKNGSFSRNLLTHAIACLSLQARKDPACIV